MLFLLIQNYFNTKIVFIVCFLESHVPDRPQIPDPDPGHHPRLGREKGQTVAGAVLDLEGRRRGQRTRTGQSGRRLRGQNRLQIL